MNVLYVLCDNSGSPSPDDLTPYIPAVWRPISELGEFERIGSCVIVERDKRRFLLEWNIGSFGQVMWWSDSVSIKQAGGFYSGDLAEKFPTARFFPLPEADR